MEPPQQQQIKHQKEFSLNFNMLYWLSNLKKDK